MRPRGAPARPGRAHRPARAAAVDLFGTTDLGAFREAVQRLSRAEAEQLRSELAGATADEPTQRQLQQGVRLVDRMRSPAAVLLRQIRMEKLRILAEELAPD